MKMNISSSKENINDTPATVEFRSDVISGLSKRQKKLTPKYFYDEIGSVLFEKITQLPEYYVTRTELSILRNIAWT
jgi:L-histidine N-alpha-methyltransferase